MRSFQRQAQAPSAPNGPREAMARPSPVASSARKCRCGRWSNAGAGRTQRHPQVVRPGPAPCAPHARRPWAAPARPAGAITDREHLRVRHRAQLRVDAHEAVGIDRQRAAPGRVDLPVMRLGAGGPQHHVAALVDGVAPAGVELHHHPSLRQRAVCRTPGRRRQAGKQRLAAGDQPALDAAARLQAAQALQQGQQRLEARGTATHGSDAAETAVPGRQIQQLIQPLPQQRQQPGGRWARSAGASMSATGGSSCQRMPAARSRARVSAITPGWLQVMPWNQRGSARRCPTRA
jgi:hypothetical protein